MNLQTLFYIGSIIFLLLILVKSADLIEDSFVYISKSLKVSEFFMGFVILSAVSSLPEFSIALSSSEEVPELSIGNLLGATFILLTLIVGLSVIRFGDFKFRGKFNEKEIVSALLIILLIPLTLADKQLSVFDALILLISYIVYIFHLNTVFKRKGIPKNHNPQIGAKKVYLLLLKALLGIVVLFASSTFLVNSVISLGNEIHISESLIGLFVLGIGTNVPELAILFRAKNKDQRNLATGNSVGSACINAALLGFLGLFTKGIAIKEFGVILPALVLITIAIISFLAFSWTGKTITKKEAAFLIFLYLILIFVEAYRLI